MNTNLPMTFLERHEETAWRISGQRTELTELPLTKMLFLGLGTGLGTAMVVDGIVVPMEPGGRRPVKQKAASFVSDKRRTPMNQATG